MELRHLRYFVQVAEIENLTRAAEQLGIKQPPLGQQIRALETELGVKLFDRSPKRIRLNAAGKVFLQAARVTLAAAEDAVQQVRRFERGEEGSIAIGFTSSASFHSLTPQLIREFRKSYPFANVDVQEQETYALVLGLQERRIDAAILRAPTEKFADLTSMPLGEELMVAAVPARHPLAREGGKPLSLLAVSKEDFVAYRRPDGPGIFDWLSQHVSRAGLRLHVVEEVSRMIAAINLVAAGRGLSIVPSCMQVLHRNSIVYRPIRRGALPPIALNLVYRSDNRVRLVRNFVSAAKALRKG